MFSQIKTPRCRYRGGYKSSKTNAGKEINTYKGITITYINIMIIITQECSVKLRRIDHDQEAYINGQISEGK